MITEKKSGHTPPRQETSSERKARLLALLSKIEDAVAPVLVADMTDVASEMLRIGIMQMFDSKQVALRYLDATYIRMAEMIDDGFEQYKQDQKKRGLH
jgi:hypothetical protein